MAARPNPDTMPTLPPQAVSEKVSVPSKLALPAERPPTPTAASTSSSSSDEEAAIAPPATSLTRRRVAAARPPPPRPAKRRPLHAGEGRPSKRARQRWADTVEMLSLANGIESDPHRLSQRQKQIDIGKNTLAYDKFIAAVPRDRRRRGHPMTPLPQQKCSKRSFDGQITSWKKRVYAFVADMEEREIRERGAHAGLTKVQDKDNVDIANVDPQDPAGERTACDVAKAEDGNVAAVEQKCTDHENGKNEVVEKISTGPVDDMDIDWDDSDIELDDFGNVVEPEALSL